MTDSVGDTRTDGTGREGLPYRHTSKHVSLVNRHWHAAANENLYRTVFIHRETTIQLFVKAVTLNPDLLYLIKSVTIDYKYNGLPTQPKALKKALNLRKKNSKLTWELLGLLRPGRLMHLELESGSFYQASTDALDTLIPALRGLVHLTLRSTRPSHHPYDLRRWIEPAKPTLRRLSLCSLPLVGEEIPDGMQLRTLRIDVSSILTAEQLRSLLCRNTLETLSLKFSTYFRFNLLPAVWELELLKVAPRLRALRVLWQWTLLQQGQDFLRVFCNILDKAKTLQVLHLLIEDIAVIIPDHLPTSLRRLLLHVYPPGHDRAASQTMMFNAVDAVLDASLPLLSHLTVVPRFDDVEIESPEADKLIAAGAARGIAVQFLLSLPTEDWTE